MKKPTTPEGDFARIPAEEYFVLSHQNLALRALKTLNDEHRSLASEHSAKVRKLTHFLEALHVRQIDAGQVEMFPRDQMLTDELKQLLGL